MNIQGDLRMNMVRIERRVRVGRSKKAREGRA